MALKTFLSGNLCRKLNISEKWAKNKHESSFTLNLILSSIFNNETLKITKILFNLKSFEKAQPKTSNLKPVALTYI